MKKLMLLVSTILFINALSIAQTSAPEIKFEKKVHDYGTILKGSNGDCEFVYKNVGDEPLIITSVQKSCGCTIPTWDPKPVLPGQSGTIKVGYDTQRVGPFNKQITVISNAKNSTEVLTIQGNVVESIQSTNTKSESN
ncbi:MAG TPA: DUF1573 domain-containing protein [Bacteroidales bacterium]|nr:DUF1573 domain-containing protein [Bacteroidales bacterium]